MNRKILVSISLAIILMSVSVVGVAIIGPSNTEQTNSTASEMTVEEYNELKNEYAKEVESSTGMSYEEYCSEIELLNDKLIYVYLDENDDISIDIVETIDNGRNGFDYVSYGFNIYLDSRVCAGLAGVTTGAAIGILCSSGVGTVVATFIAGYIVQWINEYAGWGDGIIIEVHCWHEIKIWGHTIRLALPKNMWTYDIRGQ